MNKVLSVLVLLMLILVSCTDVPKMGRLENPMSSTRLVETVGKSEVDSIQNAELITLVNLRSREQFDLSERQVDQLKKLLLNDASYTFDRQKKCPFFAEYRLSFVVNPQQIATLRVSLGCAKIEFSNLKLLDCDPILAELEKIVK